MAIARTHVRGKQTLKYMTYHLRTKSGRPFCEPKKGGFVTTDIKKCNCSACLNKLRMYELQTTPRPSPED